jgi:hypothetical protein
MAIISTRQQLVEYCLRRLGEPVIEVNVDEDQIDDKVDDALQVYREFHSDATYRDYYQYQVTEEDLGRKYVVIPNEILYVTKIFPTGGSTIGSSNMFSFNYQFAMSDFHSLTDEGSGGLAYYDQMRSYMELLDMKLNGLPMITWARRQNKLYLWSDIEDGQLQAGQWICAEVHRAVSETGEIGTGVSDPTTIMNDMFMKDYTTSLIKLQWGINMSKFEGMQLPGGVTVNGRQLVDDANGELEALRERMRLEQEEPPMFLVG